MRRLVALLAPVLACALSLAPHGRVQAQGEPTGHPQPKLPTVRIEAGLHVIRAELADTAATRATGLMGRESLGPNEGMLFVFENSGVHCFWMRNTPLPLSIAFIDDDGRIVDIARMAPFSERSHCPGTPVRYALEMEQGWFAKRGLRPGTHLKQPALFGTKR